MQRPKSASGFSSPTQCRASSKAAVLVDLLLRKALMQVSRSHRSLTGRCLVGGRRQVTADDPERNGNCCRGSTGGKMVTNRPSVPILGIGGRCQAKQPNIFIAQTRFRVGKISAAKHGLQWDFNLRISDMKKFLKMAALGLALTVGGTNANASVPLPMFEQASGAFSLASLLKQITPAVVSIAIKGGAKNAALNSSPNKGQRAQRAASARDLGRATGSGVVIDAGEGIILTNAHVIAGADEITVAAADLRRRIGLPP